MQGVATASLPHKVVEGMLVERIPAIDPHVTSKMASSMRCATLNQVYMKKRRIKVELEITCMDTVLLGEKVGPVSNRFLWQLCSIQSAVNIWQIELSRTCETSPNSDKAPTN